MRDETPKPAPIKLNRSHIQTIDVRFSFLTYVFGGGVEHLKNSQDTREPMRPHDPVTPVRSTGVRGALRMWWRFTTGARCKSLEEMRKREQSLWGGVWEEDKPSQVGVTVDAQGQVPTKFPVFKWDHGRFPKPANPQAEGIEYGAFPMRPEGKTNEGPDPRSSLWDHNDNTYRLSLDVLDPTRLDEVKLALSAWLTVGGYGGRTSRGFGAVKLVSCDMDGVTDDPEALRVRLERLGPPRVEAVPALVADADAWAVRKRPSQPLRAWATCLKEMKAFRQYRRSGNEPNRPGRSYWPEPDAMRRLTRRYSPDHKQHVSHIDAFPRADFGMPIIFHFKDDKKGDPYDQTLQPTEDVDRYPSPVILRPSSDGRPMVVRLANTTAPERPFLKGVGKTVRKTPTEQELSRASDRERSRLEPDAVSAFMNMFRD